MQPVLVQWGELTIGSYAACMTIGLLAAILVVAIEARRLRIRSAVWLDAALAAITIGVVCARLGYAAINWAYYQDHLAEIPRIWQGGLNWQAGLIGGSIGAWLIAQREAAPMRVLDLLALGAPAGVACAWLGSYLSATAYGKELFPGDTFFFLAVDTPDWYGVTNPRWPTQLLGVVWALILFAALWSTRKRSWPDGTRYWLFVAAYSLGAFCLGFTRGDDMPLIAGWRIDQLLDVGLVLIGAVQLARLQRKRERLTTPGAGGTLSVEDTPNNPTPDSRTSP